MKRAAPDKPTSETSNVENVNYYFKVTDNPDRWICRCGKKLKQEKKTGYSNLMSHITKQHKDYINEVQTQKKGGQLDKYGFSPCEAAMQIYGWMDLIISEGYYFVHLIHLFFPTYSIRLPFSTCEKAIYRKYVNLKPMSLTSFMKYMQLLTTALEKKIAELLPNKFPIVFDGWSLDGASTHYIAIYARWLNSRNGT
jgi:hypothetical protein